MADKKIIAVVGATGSQGGGLCQAILADPNGGFAVRAITRDPNKDNAKAWRRRGRRSFRRISTTLKPEEGIRRRAWRLLRHELLGALLR